MSGRKAPPTFSNRGGASGASRARGLAFVAGLGDLRAMTASPGSVAIVTGAGSGIGRAVAQRFAAAGWRVTLVGRRRDALEETARLAGGACTVAPADVADAAAVGRVVAATLAAAGRIDVLAHCAGTNIARRSWENLSAEDYRAV